MKQSHESHEARESHEVPSESIFGDAWLLVFAAFLSILLKIWQEGYFVSDC